MLPPSAVPQPIPSEYTALPQECQGSRNDKHELPCSEESEGLDLLPAAQKPGPWPKGPHSHT